MEHNKSKIQLHLLRFIRPVAHYGIVVLVTNILDCIYNMYTDNVNRNLLDMHMVLVLWFMVVIIVWIMMYDYTSALRSYLNNWYHLHNCIVFYIHVHVMVIIWQYGHTFIFLNAKIYIYSCLYMLQSSVKLSFFLFLSITLPKPHGF